MQKIILGLLTLTCVSLSYGQKNINLALKGELDSIYILDQKYRELFSLDILRTKADSIAASYKVSSKDLLNYLIMAMNQTDSSNMARVEQIIRKYGYPGKSLVGIPANETVFYVIQHSKYIDKYLEIIKKAATRNELAFKLYAMMLDRSLMYKGKEQIYGTQGKGFECKNPQTGQTEFKMIVWPVKNPQTVNVRRKKAGFKDTVEVSAKSMGIEYKVYSLEDFKGMQAK